MQSVWVDATLSGGGRRRFLTSGGCGLQSMEVLEEENRELAGRIAAANKEQVGEPLAPFLLVPSPWRAGVTGGRVRVPARGWRWMARL